MPDDGPPPRVLHVIPSDVAAGAERVVRTLVARLPEHGVDADALYFLPRPDGESDPRFLGRPRQHDPRLLVDLRRRLRRWSRPTDGGAPVTSIVHTHLGWPLYFTRFAALSLDLVRVHTEHSTGNVRRGRALRGVERWAYGGVRELYCVSEAVLESARAWLGSAAPPLVVVWNGARAYRPVRRSAPGGRARLVSVGSLAPHKGIDTALEAVARARDAVEAYRIVGDGPERERLETLARSLGIDDLVTFAGVADDVEPHLHWAHGLLVPSRREGFGLVAVEALSTGLPVIAADVPGLAGVVAGAGPAARLVPPDDAHAWADAITALSRTTATAYRALREPAERHARRFSVDAMVAAYAERYRGLTRARRTGGRRG